MKVGVNGAVRDISDIKVGVSGAVRAVSEGYAGVGGAVKKIWPVIGALNDYTWDEISEISSSGEAASMFKVGDCKEIVLNGTVGALTFNDYHTYAFIIGFDHNASREGSNRIHFQLAKTALSGGKDICFADGSYNSSGSSAAFRMNTSRTNSGGWEDSYMRNSICGGSSKNPMTGYFGSTIPFDLFSVLKPVTKYTNNNGRSVASSAVTATTDYFFLLSEYEVFGNIKYSNGYEANYQQQYAYYSAGNSEVKYRHNSTGSAAGWWLRSPRAGNSDYFVYVGSTVYFSYANDSFGFAPGFCV